jgi:hypothetical protein
MSGTALDHPLVRDYLRDLDQALAALPAEQASELTEQITGHLDEALAPGSTDEEVAAVLARLGHPADLAAEAMPEPAELAAPRAPAPPARELRQRKLRWPRLGWRRWTAISAATIILAAAAGYAIAMNTATPIQLANDSGWWAPWHPGREVDTQANQREQATVPIQSGRRQGFYITVINPSAWPETVVGVAPGQASPGSRTARIGVSPMNLDNGGFPTWHLRFYLPFTIPPQQTRALRVQWVSDICLRKGQTNGIGQLALRVRVGWLTRTEVIQLPEGFYLSGPSHGPCP